MNTPNPTPFTPSPSGFGSPSVSKGRARLKLAILVVLAMHVLLFGGLLLQGCKPESTERTPVYGDAPPPAQLPSPPPVTEPAAPPPDLTTGAPPVSAPAVTPPVTMPLEPLPPQPAPTAQQYEVAAGDTFYSIGQKFGVSMKAIADANPGVDPRRLRIGQKLVIPAPQPATAGAPVAAPTPAGAPGEIIYTVKSGDNLTRIAAQHGTTVKAIRAANNLTTDRIKVGDKLRIPVATPTQPVPPQPGVPQP